MPKFIMIVCPQAVGKMTVGQELSKITNLKWSENDIIKSIEKHRLNSNPNEIPFENYLRIDNTNISA